MVTSSSETRDWLQLLISAVTKQIAHLEYVESKFWGTFKNRLTHRNVVYLQSTKKQIRLHTRLPLSYDDALEATSASKQWAKTCPSLFRVRSKSDIEKAVSLVASSFDFDIASK